MKGFLIGTFLLVEEYVCIPIWMFRLIIVQTNDKKIEGDTTQWKNRKLRNAKNMMIRMEF